MKRVLMAIAAALTFLAAPLAHAQIDFNKTINLLGVQGSNAYFSAIEGLTLNCDFGIILADLTTVGGRAAYAQLLAAKFTASSLSRIDYVQPGGSGTICQLQLVEVQN